MPKELILKESKSGALFGCLSLTGIVLLLIYMNGANLFDWKDFNPHGYDTIMFILILFGCIYGWAAYFFDKGPKLIIDHSGISKRTHVFSKIMRQKVNWETVTYFFVLETHNKILEQHLIFRTKEGERDIKIGISSLDSPTHEIIALVKEYSEIFGFHDLGIEVKK